MVALKRKLKNPLPLGKIQKLIESAVDRADKVVNLGMKLGIAYAGVNAFRHPMGGVAALLGLHLTQQPNLAAGAAGVTTLAGVGAFNLFPPAPPPPPPADFDIPFVPPHLEAHIWNLIDIFGLAYLFDKPPPYIAPLATGQWYTTEGGYKAEP